MEYYFSSLFTHKPHSKVFGILNGKSIYETRVYAANVRIFSFLYNCFENPFDNILNELFQSFNVYVFH